MTAMSEVERGVSCRLVVMVHVVKAYKRDLEFPVLTKFVGLLSQHLTNSTVKSVDCSVCLGM